MLGKVNYVDFLAGLVISLTCIGIPLYGVREIARYRNEVTMRRRLFGSLLRLHLLAAFAGCIGFVLFLYVHPRYTDEHWLIAMGVVYILSNVLAAEWYLQGIEAFPFISIRSIILRALGLAAIFIFIHQPDDYILYYAIIALTMLLTLIINFTRIKPSLNIVKSSATEKEYLPVLLNFFIASTFISIYDYIDTVMLGWLARDENVGYYTASMKLVKLSLLLILTINVILFPRLSHLVAEKKEEEINALLHKSMSFIITAAVPGMALYILLAPELIALFAGSGFAPSVPVMQWLSPLPLVIALSNLWLLYYLSRFTQKNKQLLWLAAIALLISISLNYWLIPLLQQEGAAIASVCTETFIMLFLGITMNIKIPRNAVWQSIIGSSFLIPLTMLVRKIFSGHAETFVFMLVAGGVLYFTIQAFLFRNESILAIFRYVNTIIRSRNQNS